MRQMLGVSEITPSLFGIGPIEKKQMSRMTVAHKVKISIQGVNTVQHIL